MVFRRCRGEEERGRRGEDEKERGSEGVQQCINRVTQCNSVVKKIKKSKYEIKP
jgi:hypothetical protein